MRLDRIPNYVGNSFSKEAIEKRIKWLEAVSKKDILELRNHTLNPYELPGNIENFIGAVQIPVGIAGPVRVNGEYANGYFPVPIATTEGALISSITRGAVVCGLSGGIETFVSSQRMVRSPAFFCEDMKSAILLEKWVKQNFQKIKQKSESISSVANLIELETVVLSNVLHVKFYYETGDASGQNMTTACTAFACDWIEKQIKRENIRLLRYIIEGNFSGDKKLNYQNFIKGRGISVQAHCIVPDKYIKRFLRTTTKDIVKMWNSAETAAMQIGMFGSNTNFSNVVAGVFAATGQDIASVHESSGGIIRFTEKDNNLDISVFIPSLVIGTVGGGTGLPTQRESLEIMGCFGSHKVKKLAEIIAATVLSLDLSTSSAIAANEFVKAHERLGRNRPKKKEIVVFDNEFFNKLFNQGEVVSFSSNLLENKHGITSGLVDDSKKSQETISKYLLEVKKDDSMSIEKISVVLKIKSQESDIVDTGIKIAKLSGEDRLPGLFENYRSIFGFDNCNIREREIFSNPRDLRSFMPEIFGSCKHSNDDFFAILMEDLSNHKLIDSVDEFYKWQKSEIKTVLKDLARFHSVYFDNLNSIPKEWMIEENIPDKLKNASSFLMEFTNYNASRFSEMISDSLIEKYKMFLQNTKENIKAMNAYHRTLCHNDFNLRNICLKSNEKEEKLVMYDFELARFQNPQSDLIEFLIFVLPNENFMENFKNYTYFYIENLKKLTSLQFDKKEFFEILKINAVFSGITRYNLYLLAHNLKKFSFMERVYDNLSNLILFL